MRFGIGAGDSMKLDDIADELNVSGERVRQLSHSVSENSVRSCKMEKLTSENWISL